jgi:hypothetical protein
MALNKLFIAAAAITAAAFPAAAANVSDPTNPALNTKAGFLSVVAAAKEAGGPPTTMCDRVACWSDWSGSRFKLREFDNPDGTLSAYNYTVYSKDQSIEWSFWDNGMAAKSVNGGPGRMLRQVWP